MSVKQYLIDSINADTAKAGNLKIEDYKKAATKKYAPDKKAEEDFINSTYDKAAANVQAVNDKGVRDTNTEYTSQYERNAVQKLINEKQVAEKMANLGLTDSGLNRTQQTAVQLGYANQKGKLDLAKQSTLDNLALNLTSALTEIETNRSSDLLTADQKWKNKADAEAQTNYNNDMAAINERITSAYKEYGDIVKAETEAAERKAVGNNSSKTLWYNTGTYDADYNPIFRNSEGKTQAFGAGINPYTGTVHKDAKGKDGKVDSSKVFSNGYQPNNIGGKKLKAQTEYEVYVNGKKQSVWSYDNGKTMWAWDGSINEYVDVTSKKDELKK